MAHPRMLLTALVAVAAIAACSKKQPETAPAPVNADSIAKARAADSAAQAARAKAAADSAAAAARARAAADSAAAVAAAKSAVEMEFKSKVYFDFDQSTLTDTAQRKLDRKIVIMNANPGVSIQIEGNADERGSSEYNLALAQRRAAAVKRYLVQHGIADSRITIISNGEEKPDDPGHDETAWAHNRRAEFTITMGALAPATK